MAFLRRRAPLQFAAGFPATVAVSARRIRAEGSWFRRGPVVLMNGSNAFTVDVTPFKRVAVEVDGEGGIFNIIGSKELGGSQKTVLAQFGNEEAANNGYSALMKAHAGLKAGKAGGGRLSSLKWPAFLAGLFVFVAMLGAFSGGTTEAVASSMPASVSNPEVAQAQATLQQARQQVAAGGGFNRNEPSLEALASGQYTFEPKLQAPDVTVPTLNCAQK